MALYKTTANLFSNVSLGNFALLILKGYLFAYTVCYNITLT